VTAQIIITLCSTTPADKIERRKHEAAALWPDGSVVVMSVAEYERQRRQ
jgi:hypothetical protein